MDWLIKCSDFYRIASNTDYEIYDRMAKPGEETYRKLIDNLWNHTAAAIQICIRANQRQPYFKISDFLTEDFYKKFGSAWDFWHELGRHISNWGQEGISKENIKALVNFMAKVRVEREGAGIDWHDENFLSFMQYYTPETIDFVKKKIILNLMRLRKENISDAASLWYILYDEPEESRRLFDRPFLKRLAEVFGPDFYEISYLEHFRNNVFRDEGGDDAITKDIAKKKSITMYDVILVNKLLLTYPRSFLVRMINKADPKAKDYMRRYLYNNATRYDTKTFFMLSEDMTPMDENYNEIGLPDWVGAYTLSGITDKPTVEKWTRILHEFNIIPLP